MKVYNITESGQWRRQDNVLLNVKLLRSSNAREAESKRDAIILSEPWPRWNFMRLTLFYSERLVRNPETRHRKPAPDDRRSRGISRYEAAGEEKWHSRRKKIQQLRARAFILRDEINE
ncbi:hypothetical protein EVAR_103232_1 [Eumeta japonica]|uniref:Uncharacterized protein n=1 Tax=Eumeta variegata TaxID=151549 RepID=A0A4C1X640_EUMVA|nr:hypothetical protein EVAR_103232_1 [Eumeta japonica]